MHIHLSNAGAVRDAADLIARFGPDAEMEAAARADHSRSLGNHIHFCHWRQIERLIIFLGCDESFGTVH